MAYFVAPEASPAFRHHETRTIPRFRVSPGLLFARRLIESAMHDALECRDGRPTERALESWEWLTARTDWTLRAGPIPPADTRQQFYGSFEWACRVLGEDPDRVRAQGLRSATHRIGSSQGRETWTGERVRGLQDIKRTWEIQACRGAAGVVQIHPQIHPQSGPDL
jgi:hypothetical protein